jgi:hypothetical protein
VTIEQFRATCNAQPFRPFVIHLADGRTVAVNYHEFVMPSPSGRTVAVYQPDDTLNIIDLHLFTDLELKDPRRSSD